MRLVLLLLVDFVCEIGGGGGGSSSDDGDDDDLCEKGTRILKMTMMALCYLNNACVCF